MCYNEDGDSMKNKRLTIISGVIILVVLVVGVTLGIMLSKKKYVLSLPAKDKIVSVNIEKEAKGIFLSQENDINNIYEVIEGKERKTANTLKEITNVDKPLMISFNYEDSVALTLYLYKKNGKYYMAEIDKGNYSISDKEYQSILNYLN